MKYSILTVSALTALTFAQVDSITSAPFHLVVRSNNASLHGDYLFSGHAGSMLQAFMLGDKSKPGYYETFTIQSSRLPGNLSQGFDPALQSGEMNWTLPLSNGDVHMFMVWDAQWDVGGSDSLPKDPARAVATFQANVNLTPVTVSFNQTGSMYIYEGYIPDGGHAHQVYHESHNWYICESQLSSRSIGLAWYPRDSSPADPGCQKVDVYRELA